MLISILTVKKITKYINLHKPADLDTTGERRLILANNPVLGIFTGVSTFTGLLSRAIALSNSTDETFPGRLTPHERPWQNQRQHQYVDLVGDWRALEAQLSGLLKGTPKFTRKSGNFIQQEKLKLLVGHIALVVNSSFQIVTSIPTTPMDGGKHTISFGWRVVT